MAFGIYIHWPFCKSKCPYCDFNSHVSESIHHSEWRDAYLKTLSYWFSKTSDRTVDSIFFGGGTPSLMEAETVSAVISFIKDHWGVSDACEVTLEANPTSFEIPKFEAFHKAGVNRVSIGVQSFNEADLKFLGREHSPDQARLAISEAGRIFDRVSFDLIYARPRQTVEAWRRELEEALPLVKGHLSLYQLTIEQGTPFYTRHARGEFRIPEQDLAADLYDVTQEILDGAGLPAYEVSNHAAAGQESRHNLVYWQYDDYIGIGPGAHGRVTLDGQKFATKDHRAPSIWLDKVAATSVGGDTPEKLSADMQFQECVMMGMRLKKGVPFEKLSAILGRNVFDVLDRSVIEGLADQGILEQDQKTLRTTAQGFKCLNAVLGYLLSRAHHAG